MKFVLFLLVVLALVLLLRRRGVPDVVGRQPVQEFDLARYMGRWYEIARLDNRFERNMEQVEAYYRIVGDDRVEVLNSGLDVKTGLRRTVRGKAKEGKYPGWLRVSFFWIFYTDYIVLELGENYDWALVGGRSGKFLWILSRTPTLPAATLDRILQRARDRGYAVERLHFVEQSAGSDADAGV